MHLRNSSKRMHRCCPFSSDENLKHHEEMDNFGLIVMPESEIKHLFTSEFYDPIILKLTNFKDECVVHCGVLQFRRGEDVYLPQLIMERLNVNHGDFVQIEKAQLPKAQSVTLQPHANSYLNIVDIRAALQHTLEKLVCLTQGDCVTVNADGAQYRFNVTRTLPEETVSIANCDLPVEFTPSLEETQCPTKNKIQDSRFLAKHSGNPFIPFSGTGKTTSGKIVKNEVVKPATRGIPDWSYVPNHLNFIRNQSEQPNFEEKRFKEMAAQTETQEGVPHSASVEMIHNEDRACTEPDCSSVKRTNKESAEETDQRKRVKYT